MSNVKTYNIVMSEDTLNKSRNKLTFNNNIGDYTSKLKKKKFKIVYKNGTKNYINTQTTEELENIEKLQRRKLIQDMMTNNSTSPKKISKKMQEHTSFMSVVRQKNLPYMKKTTTSSQCSNISTKYDETFNNHKRLLSGQTMITTTNLNTRADTRVYSARTAQTLKTISCQKSRPETVYKNLHTITTSTRMQTENNDYRNNVNDMFDKIYENEHIELFNEINLKPIISTIPDKKNTNTGTFDPDFFIKHEEKKPRNINSGLYKGSFLSTNGYHRYIGNMPKIKNTDEKKHMKLDLRVFNKLGYEKVKLNKDYKDHLYNSKTSNFFEGLKNIKKVIKKEVKSRRQSAGKPRTVGLFTSISSQRTKDEDNTRLKTDIYDFE